MSEVELSVRLANSDLDCSAVADIYAPAVATVTSFEEIAPNATEMARRIRAVLERAPWLVAMGPDGRVLGYAYASQHNERAAYRWSVNISVYVDANHRRRGIGRRLYRELLALLRQQRFVNVYAGITLPNRASVALHEAIGMRLVGVYERVGYKHGAWHDVAWYGMRLVDDGAPPTEPRSLASLGHIR